MSSWSAAARQVAWNGVYSQTHGGYHETPRIATRFPMNSFVNDPNTYNQFGGISIGLWIEFFIAASGVWLFFYVVRRKAWLPRKIIAGFPAFREVAREMTLSASTCAIYGVVTLLTWWAINKGWTRIYFDIHQYSWGWFAGSIALTIVLHDAYFYWTHRLMHHPRLFRWLHRLHHRSMNPTPWAAYAFDPSEAFVQAGIFPLVLFLYPMHPLAFFIFMVWQITYNVLGHSGFEIYPSWFMDTWLGKFCNTSTNHIMHHQYFKGNYGLYFNYWDRLMGTNHKRYEERFREVTAD